MPTHESTFHAPPLGANDDHDGDGDGDGDSEWRFSVDDTGPDDIIDDESEVEQLPIELESPRAENIVFVLLSVLLATRLAVVTMHPGTL